MFYRRNIESESSFLMQAKNSPEIVAEQVGILKISFFYRSFYIIEKEEA